MEVITRVMPKNGKEKKTELLGSLVSGEARKVRYQRKPLCESSSTRLSRCWMCACVGTRGRGRLWSLDKRHIDGLFRPKVRAQSVLG